MRTRLRKSSQSPDLFWVEGNHPVLGWVPIRLEPMRREDAYLVLNREARVSRRPERKNYDYIRKCSSLMEEIDILNGKIASPHVKIHRKQAMRERRKELLKYVLQMILEMA